MILCRYFCINLKMLGFMNFYIEIYQEIVKKMKPSR
jgi:hypothetical protein